MLCMLVLAIFALSPRVLSYCIWYNQIYYCMKDIFLQTKYSRGFWTNVALLFLFLFLQSFLYLVLV